MRIVFIGTGEIGVPTLRALLNSAHELVAVLTQPDKHVGREQQIEPPPIKEALLGSARRWRAASGGPPEGSAGGKHADRANGPGVASRPAAEPSTRAACAPQILKPPRIKDPQAI